MLKLAPTSLLQHGIHYLSFVSVVPVGFGRVICFVSSNGRNAGFSVAILPAANAPRSSVASATSSKPSGARTLPLFLAQLAFRLGPDTHCRFRYSGNYSHTSKKVRQVVLADFFALTPAEAVRLVISRIVPEAAQEPPTSWPWCWTFARLRLVAF